MECGWKSADKRTVVRVSERSGKKTDRLQKPILEVAADGRGDCRIFFEKARFRQKYRGQLLTWGVLTSIPKTNGASLEARPT